MEDTFTVYPAIDLRHGQVVRLAQGDPQRQKVYGNDPAVVARRWLESGALWLHVVNLDGAFGEPEKANHAALEAICREASFRANIQFGGGLRTLEDIQRAFTAGASRVVLGTLAAEQPELATQAVALFGDEHVALGVDVRGGRIRLRGWMEESSMDPAVLGRSFYQMGVRACVFTNIARDGLGQGVDVETSQQFARETGLAVIASGGVATLDDVRCVRQAGLSGVIIGRALYEGTIDLKDAISL